MLQNRSEYKGLIAATFTPMHSGGQLNLDRIPAIVEHLVNDGISGLYVCGSTGEGPSLTIEERRAVAEAYVKAAAGRISVIIHVGHDSLEEAKGLARHAESVGADAVAAMPPAYFKCRTMEQLLDTLGAIASASNLPFFYYHIPVMNGYNFSMMELLDRAPAQIPTFAGIKFSSTDLTELQGCLEHGSAQLPVLFGVDEMLLGAVAMGAQGAVGSTYNFAAPLYRRVIDAFNAGDMATARQLQKKAADVVRIAVKFRGAPALKAMMGLIGLDCGPSRLPQMALTDDEIARLRAALESDGLLDAIRGKA